MRRHSKGGGGCAVAASAQPPTWARTPTRHSPSPTAVQTTPALAFVTVSGEPLADDLTGGAGPFRERAWQVVASLIHQTASGVLQ
jgi:hypothetical protein